MHKEKCGLFTSWSVRCFPSFLLESNLPYIALYFRISSSLCGSSSLISKMWPIILANFLLVFSSSFTSFITHFSAAWGPFVPHTRLQRARQQHPAPRYFLLGKLESQGQLGRGCARSQWHGGLARVETHWYSAALSSPPRLISPVPSSAHRWWQHTWGFL